MVNTTTNPAKIGPANRSLPASGPLSGSISGLKTILTKHLNMPLPKRVTSWIDNRPVAPAPNAVTLPIIYPATEEIIGELQEADVGEVAEAIAAARRAFDSGPWPRFSVARRVEILRAIRQTVLNHADELATLETIDTGLPYHAVRNRFLRRVALNFEFFADLANTASGETFQQTEDFLSLVTRSPVGVAAILAPWNAPLALATMKIASCIAFGNTCVVKPSEHTPLALTRLMALMAEAGLPAGVVNLVNGHGAVTGASLIEHASVDMVAFIGSTATGQSILAKAAPTLKRTALELGGKSANIVFASADQDRALDGALLAIYENNGQQCLAGSRILLERKIADRFIERFVKRAEAIRLGDPFEAATESGPLAFAAHMDKVLSYVDVARAEGAELLTGGKRASQFERGYFMEPTAVLASTNAARVCQEEIFGPFASFVLFDEPEEAVAIANDTEFGLVAYLWSDHLPTATAAAAGLNAGTVWVNTPIVRDIRAPFGGVKMSGLGRDGARASTDFFTEEKTTILPLVTKPLAKLGAKLGEDAAV